MVGVREGIRIICLGVIVFESFCDGIGLFYSFFICWKWRKNIKIIELDILKLGFYLFLYLFSIENFKK